MLTVKFAREKQKDVFRHAESQKIKVPPMKLFRGSC